MKGDRKKDFLSIYDEGTYKALASIGNRIQKIAGQEICEELGLNDVEVEIKGGVTPSNNLVDAIVLTNDNQELFKIEFKSSSREQHYGGGDERKIEKLMQKYVGIQDANGYEFERGLKRYFGGEKLKVKHWGGGYVFAASRERRIKTLEQLGKAIKAEDSYFTSVLDEFVEWLGVNGLRLGDRSEEILRKRIRAIYVAYPCGVAKDLCAHLMDEDRPNRSDVYLWWGGEPDNNSCYALLTLFFEVDTKDIGTSEFNERVSRNLTAIINIAEKEHALLSSDREFKPHVWKAIFS